MKWEDAKKELLKNPEVKKAHERFDFWYWVNRKLTDFKIWWAGL